MNLVLFLSCPFNTQGRENAADVCCLFFGGFFCVLFFGVFFKNISLYTGIYRPISFKFGMMIEISKLYNWTSVSMTLTSNEGHCCMRNNNT